MTFVYPLLLGGILLAAVPVLLHFLIRKKPKTLLFPAFRFLIQKRKSNTRSLRLKHLLLLLLRVALVLLVVFALARPRLFHEAMGLSREKPVALVLVFDTSPSMEYKSNEITQFDLAKKRSLELLDQLTEDCRVLILDTSTPDSFAREEWVKSLAKARQRIQSLTIRPHGTPVTKALEEALGCFDRLDEAAKESMPRLVCVLSDRTRASWNTGTVARAGTDKPAKFLYFDVGIDEPIDLAITHVELPRDYRGEPRQAFAEGEKIELRAVVKATGQKITSTLICNIGATEVRQAFNVEAGAQEAVTVIIDSAKLGLKPGLHQAAIRLEAATDLLAFNNQRHVTFKILDKPRVLVLVDDVKRTQRIAWALEDLGYTVEHKTIAEKLHFSADQTVFLVGAAAPPPKLWTDLLSHVGGGGGLCVVPPGDELQSPAYNSEPAQRLLPARVGVKVVAELGVTWDLERNDLQHPFLRPMIGWLERGNVDFLRLPRRAQAHWQVWPHMDEKSVATVVSYDDEKSRPAIVERIFPKGGKVLLLTSPMDTHSPEWNNYGAKLTSFYLALTMMSAKHLGSAAENPKLNFEFGGEFPHFTRSLRDMLPKYVLTRGDVTEEASFDGKNRWVGDYLLRPGNYTLFGIDPAINKTEALYKFSIDVRGEESDLTRVAKEEIEIALGDGVLVPIDRRTSLLEALGPTWDEPVELLPWLLIALLLFLAFENLLANKFYRQQAEETA